MTDIISPFVLLFLAFLFAALAYYIGVLLVALPIFAKGLRKLGYRMVAEGTGTILIMILLLSFTLIWTSILNIVFPCKNWWDILGWFQGWSPCYNNYAIFDAYSAAREWIANEANHMASICGIVEALPLALKAAQVTSPFIKIAQLVMMANEMSQYTAPWLTVERMYIMELNFLKILVDFFGKYWAIFIILGTFFYAIPGRIGRAAAGVLVGTPIGYLITIPFLPMFMNTFSPDPFNVFLNINWSDIQSVINAAATVMDPALIYKIFIDLLASGYAILLRLVFLNLYLLGIVTPMSASIAKLLSGVSFEMPGLSGV